MPGGLPLGELVVWRGVPDEEDGDGSQANVSHHVLIVTRLSSNLELNHYCYRRQAHLNLRRRP